MSVMLQLATKEQAANLIRAGMMPKFSDGTVALALKWLRDAKKIDVEVLPSYNSDGRIYFCQVVVYHKDNVEVLRLNDEPLAADYTPMTIFNTHEEAESAGLSYALDYIIKTEQSKNTIHEKTA